MRQVNFTEVGMKNFGPYIDPMILTFQNDSLTLMTGPNGIGKTMSLDAIPFTLYGITSKGAKGDDVVNDHVGRNCHTWVKFEIDGVKYEVNRYHKYTKYGNTVILKKDGVDIKKGTREVVPEVEKILCPRKSFLNTLMFGQKVKDFFTDLVDSDKKEIFRKILGLDNYTLYYKKADELIKQTNEEINSTKNQIEINKGLLEDADTQITILTGLKDDFNKKIETQLNEQKMIIEDCKRMLESWKKELGELEEKNHDTDSINREIVTLQTEIKIQEQSVRSKYSELKNQKGTKLSELQNTASTVKNEILELFNSEIESLMVENQAERDEVRKNISNLEKQLSTLKSEVSGHQSTIVMMNKNRDQLEESLLSEDSICPTCGQDISDEHKQHLKDEIEDIEKGKATIAEKINTAEAKMNNLLLQKDSEDRQLERVIAEYDLCSNDLETVKNQKNYEADQRLSSAIIKLDQAFKERLLKLDDELEQESSELSSKLAKLESEKSERQQVFDKIEEAQGAIKKHDLDMLTAEARIEELEAEEYNETQLNSYKKKKIDLGAKLKSDKSDLRQLDRYAKILGFWKAAFSSSGIPSMLIDEAIPFMNHKVSEYLDKLANGRYIVSFDTLATTKAGQFRDKISVHVLDTHTKANSRIKLSGGQTRIIDIATILTLGDLQSNIQDVSFNILLFDEIFDSLDEENIGFVSKIFATLKFGKSIYLISHRHEDQLEPDEVLVLN